MKKSLLLFAFIVLIVFNGNCQDVKIGVRFKPLNSSSLTHDLLNYSPTQTMVDNTKNRFDSLTVGVFFEKYFSKKAFLIRVDFNYADLQSSNTENTNSTSQWDTTANDFNDVLKQKYFNVNLGIGTHANWNKFIFTFGVSIPLTFLPKGVQTRDVNYYNGYVKTQSTKGTGTFKPSMGVGIGAFAGVSTIILKHLSIGVDVSYQIEYLSRNLTWHGETYYYQSNPNMTYADEKIKTRTFYTSKVVPSIVIAYAFDCRKKEKK